MEAFHDSDLAFVMQTEASFPTNPFQTANYARARIKMGQSVWIFRVDSADGAPPLAITAFMRQGRVSAALEIPSLPGALSAGTMSEILGFCRSHRVTSLTVGTFASPALRLPRVDAGAMPFRRTEFLISLVRNSDDWGFSRTHRQRARQGEKMGFTVQRSADPAICRSHVGVMAASMARRQGRGEAVTTDIATTEMEALLASGAGEIFQSVHEGEVISSMLVLRAPRGGYDHSSGNTPFGMSKGSSHFLILSVARILQSEGAEVFNLGGVREDEQGLRGFKENFGTQQIETEALEVQMPGGLLARVSGGVRSVLRPFLKQRRG